MGLYYREKFKNGAEIAVWEITETEPELAKHCVLPSDEQEELEYTTNPQRRLERLAVRALLDILFPEKVYLRYHDNGRPYLGNSIVELSITHTKRFVCVLTHSSLSVGVDMESLTRDFSAVQSKALNQDEQDYLSDRDDIKNHQLAIIWCAKEAMFKYMSINDVNFAKQIIVDHFTPHEEGDLEVCFIDKEGEEEWYDMNYLTVDDHVVVFIVA